MAGQDAVTAISGGLPDSIRLENPTSFQTDPGMVSLSEMAQNILSRIGTLQEGFEATVLPTASPDSQAHVGKVDELSQAREPAENKFDASVTLLAEQIQHSTQVQQQLTRFMMASSISSSLGRNLNMFLRGQ